MSGLTWDGTAESFSRDQIYHARTGTGKKIFARWFSPVELTTSRIRNHTRLIHTLLKVPTNNLLIVP